MQKSFGDYALAIYIATVHALAVAGGLYVYHTYVGNICNCIHRLLPFGMK